ncbi:MAG: hypothetical protein KF712_04055 [Akkermansiaceae bacterium]|nr:hypothetical protein [Akkermansiaceae bacterium]
MNLPEELTEAIRSRIKSEAGFSHEGIEEVLNGLQVNTPINWNILMNKELQTEKDRETDD